MTLFYSMNVDFAWGGSASASTAHLLPLTGAAAWVIPFFRLVVFLILTLEA